MAEATPVVVSDIEILREIGAGAAVYFDPHSPESFAAAIRSIEDPAEWARRSAAARERSAAYNSWERSAEALLGALRAVYEARGGNDQLRT
jgi:glycosyltransferase involved in cell wall biosynthesis